MHPLLQVRKEYATDYPGLPIAAYDGRMQQPKRIGPPSVPPPPPPLSRPMGQTGKRDRRPGG